MESGRNGNYRLEVEGTQPNDLWGVAGLLLESLFRGYGAEIGRIRVRAPYAEGDHEVPLPVGETCRSEPLN